jgi:hypothetical protein
MVKIRSKSKSRRFSFEIDKKRLIEFSQMPIAARLNWLEDANRFINSVAGKSLRKRWELIRAGKT